mmetsp:Transcript_112303/g.194719  ORF Transcript_112303/g.194719 Transcript_112303/m.194719 type:complete len:794 (+) Transcript_112303:96-2477(+)
MHYDTPQITGAGVYVQDPHDAHFASGADPHHYEQMTAMDSHGHGGHGGHDDHHGGHGGHHELPADMKIDPDSGIVPRRCTDFKCCGMFMVFACITLSAWVVAKAKGNIGRLTHGVDYYGRICGEDIGVDNMPWLFWCRDDAPSTGLPTALALSKPTCVPQCPWSLEGAAIQCLRPASVVTTTMGPGAFGTVKTQEVTMVESIIKTAPYPTKPRGGRYCMPVDENLHTTVVENAPQFDFMGRLMTSLGALGHLWWVLALVAALSLTLSWLYLKTLEYCPKVIAYVFLIPPAVGTTALCIIFAGGIVVLIERTNAFSVWYMDHIPLFSQNSLSWRQGGIICTIASVCFGFMTALFWGTWAKFEAGSVAEILHVSLDIVKNTPGIYYQPPLEALWKFLVCWFFIDGFRWLASVAVLNRNRIVINGEKFASLSQVWEYNDYFNWCMFLWVVGGIWCMEVCTAFGQMLITYAVTKYYFIKKVDGKKPKPTDFYLWKASRIIILYHPGSILKGAWWLGLKRPVRFVWWIMYEMSNHKKSSSCIGTCIARVCCLISEPANAWQGHIHAQMMEDSYPIKEGWNSVYINANDWKDATAKAHEQITQYESLKYMFTNGLYTNTKMSMCVMCVVGCSCVSTLFAYCIVTGFFPGTYDIYADPASPLYIANPYLVCLISFWLAAHVSYGFVTIWDHTMDCILYAFSWNRKYNRESVKDFVPDSVRAIVGWEDTQSDRYPYYGKAKPWMYLQSWFPGLADDKKKKDPPAAPKTEMHTAAPGASRIGTFMGSQGFTQQEVQPLVGHH